MKQFSLMLLASLFFTFSSQAQTPPLVQIDAQQHTACNASMEVVFLVRQYNGPCAIIGRTFPVTAIAGVPGTGATYDYFSLSWDIDPGAPSISNQWEFIGAYVYDCNISSYTTPAGTSGTACPFSSLEDIMLVGEPTCGYSSADCMSLSADCGTCGGPTPVFPLVSNSIEAQFSTGGLGLSTLTILSN